MPFFFLGYGDAGVCLQDDVSGVVIGRIACGLSTILCLY
ncbi:hypothetical protein M123_0613 [Bacteroides fragilis str. 3976T8]|uniref:Uncharacterized protein n=1 Tax=Bacteroides fragilis str. 3976T8 TaxID=1339314 RepID=A0A016CUC0_BACFG|nr:hypothetical protein M123_0613 [Bacteroides fragilis str. 3976T8]